MYSKRILATIGLVLACASISARSVREVLGDELLHANPGVFGLNLANKDIDDLDGLSEVASRYPDLKQLLLSNNKIVEIPRGVFLAFGNLQVLDLSHNAITHLYGGAHAFTRDHIIAREIGEPLKLSSLAGLAALEELWLNHNKLSSLPGSFGDLTALRVLKLDYNMLSNLAESFGNLTALRVLGLSHNELSSLPGSFGGFTALEGLDLNHNKLSSLPESFGGLTALEVLRLDSNNLSSLPESFGGLTALEKLGLDYNKLSSLPGSFGNLSALEALGLYDNELSSLPESFGGLTVLKLLDLNHNKLSGLPESFGSLSALKFLRLNGNQLGEVYNPTTYEGWDPIQLIGTFLLRLVGYQSLAKQLEGLPLKNVYLRGNELQPEVIEDVRRALPSAQVAA